MSLALDENDAQYQIRGYKPGYIQVNDDIMTHSIIIGPTQLIHPWTPQSIEALSAADLEIILELRPTILLLGTGENLVFPPLETYGELLNQGIGVEVMNTHAACRTFNALCAEGRNVIAALIAK